MRKFALVGWTAIVAVGAVFACGGSSKNNTDAGNSSGSSGSAGSSGSGSSGAGSSSGAGNGSCAVGQVDAGGANGACITCLQTSCQSTGQCASSACSDYSTCVCACAQGDTACQAACQSNQSTACKTCIRSIENCALQAFVQSCASQCGAADSGLAGFDGSFGGLPDGGFGGLPEGGFGGLPEGGLGLFDSGAATGACATLAACCPKLPSQNQPACTLAAGFNNQSLCQAALASLQDGGSCQ